MDGQHITLGDVEAARDRIAGLAVQTPLVPAPALAGPTGAAVWLKLESLQATGTFKLRGAANKLLSLPPAARARGVVACSAGNHGLAVATVARALGVPATICLPGWVDPAKLTNIEAAGVEVVLAGRTFDEALAVSRRLEGERGLAFVHPFDDPEVIAGQGTIGLELLEQLPGLDAVVAALSGGGLVGGIAVTLKASAPGVRVVAVSAERAPVMAESVRAGRPVELPDEPTLASALAGGIDPQNRYTLGLVRALVDELPRVSEQEIAEAMRFALRVQHLLVEGAGAVGIAAALAGKLSRGPRRIAIVISGGNVDPRDALRLFAAEPTSR